MSNLQLVQATETNGIWDRLRTSWDKQLKQHSAPKGWGGSALDHAEKIVKENGADKRYGIFVACGGKDPGSAGAPYEGFINVNFKLMHTSAAEIRLVWNRIAPTYQFEDKRVQVAAIQAAFITGAMKISAQHSKKPNVKMFLGTPTDIAFGQNFALFVSSMPAMTWGASLKGNWLHLSRVKQPKKGG